MNSEQLKKINELVDRVNRANEVFGIDKRSKMLISQIARTGIDWEIIDSALTYYCDKLKVELKELGYED